MLRFMVKKLNRRNEGISLVEIIVSLLILAIIFVPMLTSYVTANKANVMAKEKMYATVLGENVMEAVKLLGIEGTAKQCSELNTGTFVLASGAVTHKELTVKEGIANSVTSKDGKLEFSSARGTEDYAFSISNASEGTELYDVKITFSSKNYTSSGAVTPIPGEAMPTLLPNNYAFADMSAFNAVATAMINPPVEKITNKEDASKEEQIIRFDAMALEYYKQLNENYMYSKYIADRVRLTEEYNEKEKQYEIEYDTWVKNGEVGTAPTPPAPLVLPEITDSDYKTKNDAELDALMDREFTVSINLDEDKKLYLESSVIYHIDNTGGICGEDASDRFERVYTGYCVNTRYDKLQSIYLIYTPFHSDYEFNKESITVNNNIEPFYRDETGRAVYSFDVYVAVQAPADKDLSGLPKGLTVNVPKVNKYTFEGVEYSDVTLYSSAPLNTTNAKNNSIMKDISQSSERIYEVRVDVYKAGETDAIETITSTIMR